MIMVICKRCSIEKPQDEFPFRNDRSQRYRPYCNECANNITRARYDVHRREQPFKLKTSRARSRANGLKIPFDLDAEYLESIWTGLCPVLQVPIYLHERDRSDEFTAELDRFVPNKGYTKGNVHFLSRKANRLKNNVTTKELEQLINWMKQYENQ